MAEVLAIINQKGGVGKSTTAHALGQGLRLANKRVLFIDLDQQGNLTYTMQGDSPSGSTTATAGIPTAYDLLSGTPAADAILRLPDGDLIPSGPALAGADLSITATGKEFRLCEALEPIKGQYDYILIDTPPALGILTINALTAADSAIIPAQADIYSLQGIGQLYGTIDAVRKYTNPALSIRGILITRYNGRAILSRDIVDMIAEVASSLDTTVFDTRIRECIAIKEAQASRKSIFEYAPKCNAAADYEALLQEFLG